MELLINLVLLIGLCLLLVKAADMVEDALVIIATKFGINPFTVGFLVLGMASSLPEISVAISSIGQDIPQLSIGNLLGATLVLLTLVVFLNTLKHKEIPIIHQIKLPYFIAMLIVLLLPLATLLNGELDILESIILILSFVALNLFVAHGYGHIKVKQKSWYISINSLRGILLKASVSIAILMVASRLIVEVAVQTAGILGVTESLIGMLVLAIGTNVPELSITLRSKTQATENLAVGNLLGSACVNSLILGFIGFTSGPVGVEVAVLQPLLLISAIVILLLGLFAYTKNKINLIEAGILLCFYIYFVGQELAYIVQRSPVL